jgi:hypothetical protein
MCGNDADGIEDVLGSVSDGKEPAMVTKKDQPVAVVTRPDQCDEERDRTMERFWRAADRIRERTADVDPEAELQFITDTVEEVRRERYERAQRKAQNGR